MRYTITSPSDYVLTPEAVDRLHDEIKARHGWASIELRGEGIVVGVTVPGESAADEVHLDQTCGSYGLRVVRDKPRVADPIDEAEDPKWLGFLFGG